MTVLVSPSEMGVLAANASAALDFLARRGRYDTFAMKGVSEGLDFCNVIDKGQKAKSSTSYFSADGWAASRFLDDVVFQMPDGEELTKELATVSVKLQELIRSAQSGASVPRESCEYLRDYFYKFAVRLPFYEAVRQRLTESLRRRA